MCRQKPNEGRKGYKGRERDAAVREGVKMTTQRRTPREELGSPAREGTSIAYTGHEVFARKGEMLFILDSPEIHDTLRGRIRKMSRMGFIACPIALRSVRAGRCGTSSFYCASARLKTEWRDRYTRHTAEWRGRHTP